MPNFVSTFVPGFEALVARELPRRAAGCTVDRVLEGMALYRFSGKGGLPVIPFTNNTFAVLTTFPGAKNTAPLPMMLQRMSRFGVNEEARQFLPSGARTFRVVVMLEGELVSVSPGLMTRAETLLSNAFDLRVHRARPDVEFWLNYRKEGIGFLLLRLGKHRDFQKSLKPGELRPDLAAMLCLMTHPRGGDRVLDPFCGRGAILRARAGWPSKEILGSDIDAGVLADARRTGAKVQACDALNLTYLPDGSVDAVITDPPWGSYTELEDEAGFYARLAGEMNRVLTREGRVATLTSRGARAYRGFSAVFTAEEQYDILVSGKKARATLWLPR